MLSYIFPSLNVTFLILSLSDNPENLHITSYRRDLYMFQKLNQTNLFAITASLSFVLLCSINTLCLKSKYKKISPDEYNKRKNRKQTHINYIVKGFLLRLFCKFNQS